MLRPISFALLGISLLSGSEAMNGLPSIAQMGNTSTSIGTFKIQSYGSTGSIPKVTAKTVESIQRHSITTGGGYVTQGELLLPQAPSLDSRNRLHEVMKHPYETIPSLQNSRLDLIQ